MSVSSLELAYILLHSSLESFFPHIIFGLGLSYTYQPTVHIQNWPDWYTDKTVCQSLEILATGLTQLPCLAVAQYRWGGCEMAGVVNYRDAAFFFIPLLKVIRAPADLWAVINLDLDAFLYHTWSSSNCLVLMGGTAQFGVLNLLGLRCK